MTVNYALASEVTPDVQCRNCPRPVGTKAVVSVGLPYCSDECAELDFWACGDCGEDSRRCGHRPTNLIRRRRR